MRATCLLAIAFPLIAILPCQVVNAAEPDAPAGEWVDLLKSVKTDEHAVAGTWKFADGKLTVNAATGARLALDWQPTKEYDFEVTFTRGTGSDSIALIFSAGGHRATFDIDGWRAHLAGIQNVDGRTMRNNPTRVTDVTLRNGQRYVAGVRVREDRVEATLDGKVIATYRGDGSNLSLLDLWSLPEERSLGIGAWESETTFERIRVRPVGDGAKVATRENRPMPRARRNRPASTPPAKTEPEPDGDLASLSDEFDDASTLTNWLHVFREEGTNADQLQRLEVDEAGQGQLVLVPHTSSWYQDYRGVLVHRRIAGDFVVTTHAHTSSRLGRGAPRSNFSLGGLMLRAPRDVTPQTWRPGGENYIFLSLGTGDRPGQFAFEVKTTRSSNSQLELMPIQRGDAEIQAARIGEHFVMLRRLPGEDWVVHRRYRRPDMPEELQVGFTVYTDYATVSRMEPARHNVTVIRGGNPDLIARFDYFRVRRPDVPADLSGRDFSNPQSVSDAELLSFLGERAAGE